jgi:hypothetical protein
MAGWVQWTWKQSPGFPALQTIQHTPASKKLIDWMDDPSRPQPTAAEAAQGMSDFIHAIRFENTLSDRAFRQVLTRRVEQAAGQPATGDTASAPARVAVRPALRRRAPVRHRRADQRRRHTVQKRRHAVKQRHAARRRPAAARRTVRKVDRAAKSTRSTRRTAR